MVRKAFYSLPNFTKKSAQGGKFNPVKQKVGNFTKTTKQLNSQSLLNAFDKIFSKTKS